MLTSVIKPVIKSAMSPVLGERATEVIPTIPSAVNNLSASSIDNTGCTLSWTLPNEGGAPITAQIIERSLAGANSWTVLVNNLAGNVTSYEDTTAAENTAYDYRHRSVNSFGNSPYSNIVNITTAADPATVPSATTISQGTLLYNSVTITWPLPDNGGSALTSQRIERSPSGANTWSILDNAISASATSFIDTTVEPSTAYDYRHRSTNAVGNSSYSNTLTVNVPALTFPSGNDIFVRLYGADPNNTITQFNASFAPTDVILADSRINIAGTDWKDDVYGSGLNGCRFGNPVFASTTGTLPAPLTTDTPYYLKPNALGGYDVYPAGSENDYLTAPFIEDEDVVMPAQNMHWGTNKITLTTQGTGTHTFQSRELISLLDNSRVSGGTATPWGDSSDLHQLIESFIDGDGKRYWRNNLRGRFYGTKTYDLLGNAYAIRFWDENTGANRFTNARQGMVAAVLKWDETNNEGVHGFAINADDTPINTTTGVITKSLHDIISTGYSTRLRAWPGATIATGLSAGTTYYIRIIDNNTFTLHPTKADADANTNIIIPSTQGIGRTQFAIREQTGDSINRMRFPLECEVGFSGGSGVNHFIGMPTNLTGSGVQQSFLPGDLTTTGLLGTTGRAGARSALTTANLDGVKAFVVNMTNNCVRPVRADNGQPLANGIYYCNISTTSGQAVRLYDTKAQAIANVGKHDNISSHIRFSSTGFGTLQIEPAITVNGFRPCARGRTQSAAISIDRALPLNTKGVLAVVTDYNRPSASTVVADMYWNGDLIETVDLGIAKGNYGTVTSSPTISFLNSPANHVTFEGDMWDFAIGATQTEFSAATLQQLFDYYLNEYNITKQTAPGAATNLAVTSFDVCADIAFDAPASNGGFAIYEYQAQYRLQGSGTWLNGNTTKNTSVRVFGLTPSTNYEYRIIARNILGDGTPSATATGTTLALGTFAASKAASGLVFEMDASITANITDDGANNVISITDNSGYGNNLTQATSANRPKTGLSTINGQNVVTFTNSPSDTFLNFTAPLNNVEHTVFVVIDAVNSASSQCIFGGNSSRFPVLQNSNTSTTIYEPAQPVGFVDRKNGVAVTYADREAAHADYVESSTLQIRTYEKAKFDTASFKLGNGTAGFNWDGHIAHVIVYEGNKTTAEKNYIGQGLAAKWGATWTNIV